MKIQPTFLRLPVEEWAADSSYDAIGEIVSSFHVINDAAERTVKFGTDFTQVRTKSEDRRQDVIQGAELGRRAFSRATKKCFGCLPGKLDVPHLLSEIKYDAR